MMCRTAVNSIWMRSSLKCRAVRRQSRAKPRSRYRMYLLCGKNRSLCGNSRSLRRRQSRQRRRRALRRKNARRVTLSRKQSGSRYLICPLWKKRMTSIPVRCGAPHGRRRQRNAAVVRRKRQQPAKRAALPNWQNARKKKCLPPRRKHPCRTVPVGSA